MKNLKSKLSSVAAAASALFWGQFTPNANAQAPSGVAVPAAITRRESEGGFVKKLVYEPSNQKGNFELAGHRSHSSHRSHRSHSSHYSGSSAPSRPTYPTTPNRTTPSTPASSLVETKPEPKPKPPPKKKVDALSSKEIEQLGQFPQLLPKFVEVIEDTDYLIYKGEAGVGMYNAKRGVKLMVIGIKGDMLKVPAKNEGTHGEIRITSTDLGNLIDRASLAAAVAEANRDLSKEELQLLKKHIDLLPEKVTVTEDCEVTIYMDGKVVKTVEASKGQSLSVTGIRGDNLVVSAGGGQAYGEIPVAKTNLSKMVNRTKLKAAAK